MKHQLFLTKTLLIAAWLLIANAAFALTSISPTDNGFLYTGRIDFTQADKPFISWPGSSIKANITGDKLVLVMDDDEGKNFFNVIVNGNDSFPAVIALKKGVHEYDLSYLLFASKPTARHQIEIFKRTEGHEGGSRFLGFKLADGAKLLTPPSRLKRKIAYFGDSITSGMGNEAADNGDDKAGSEKNHYWSYAAITARNLQAEHHAISLSGIGFMVSWFDITMPQYYDQISAVGNNDTQWDFTSWSPDVVVVNLGQNDVWIIDDRHMLKPEPSARDIIDAYKNLLKSLRGKYPSAQFISAIGSMDLARADRNHWSKHIKTAVEELNQQDMFLTQNIEFVRFPFTGYEAHPRVKQHLSNANKLTSVIKNIMGW